MFSACEGLINPEDVDEIDINTMKEGLVSVPLEMNADQPVTFYYKAPASSPLYNCEPDLFFYTGIWYDSADWRHVQAEWAVNTDLCRME